MATSARLPGAQSHSLHFDSLENSRIWKPVQQGRKRNWTAPGRLFQCSPSSNAASTLRNHSTLQECTLHQGVHAREASHVSGLPLHAHLAITQQCTAQLSSWMRAMVAPPLLYRCCHWWHVHMPSGNPPISQTHIYGVGAVFPLSHCSLKGYSYLCWVCRWSSIPLASQACPPSEESLGSGVHDSLTSLSWLILISSPFPLFIGGVVLAPGLQQCSIGLLLMLPPTAHPSADALSLHQHPRGCPGASQEQNWSPHFKMRKINTHCLALNQF